MTASVGLEIEIEMPLVVRDLAPVVDSDTVTVGVSGPLLPSQRVFKRLLDLVVALGVLAFALPLLLLSAIAIKIDSNGPVIFRQERAGWCGRRFWCLKLRTMTVDEDPAWHLEYVTAMIHCRATRENGLFKLTSNPRITRVGRILRRFSIDELPQLWNVVRGEMSVVGPRPPVLAEAAAYRPSDWQRLQMKPGLTGLAQIRGRSGLRFDQIVAADVEYAITWSPLLELKILAVTPLRVLSGRGAA